MGGDVAEVGINFDGGRDVRRGEKGNGLQSRGIEDRHVGNHIWVFADRGWAWCGGRVEERRKGFGWGAIWECMEGGGVGQGSKGLG